MMDLNKIEIKQTEERTEWADRCFSVGTRQCGLVFLKSLQCVRFKSEPEALVGNTLMSLDTAQQEYKTETGNAKWGREGRR